MTNTTPTCRALKPPAVLLLEDDPGCRLSLPFLWNSLNLEVMVTDDGADALRICQQGIHAIGAVVVDVFMTKMRGDEFAELLAIVRPDLPVIFISGTPEEDLIARGILTGAEPFFQKPITSPALVDKLADLLGVERPRPRKRLEPGADCTFREPLTISELSTRVEPQDP